MSVNAATSTEDGLALQIRRFLCQNARKATPITYQALAKAMVLSPPNTIHKVTNALEFLIEEDAIAAHPLIAALVISKARGGLPAEGFFVCARRVGRFDGDTSGPEARAFYATEFEAAVKYWHSFI